MTELNLAERYARVLDRLDKACVASGRKRGDVRLIAVSKLHPASGMVQVAQAGQVDFGENYVQEALQKRQELALEPAMQHVRWHMIGHVQSRKAALVAGSFALVHTMDSQKLADAFEKRLLALDASQPVLLEINVGNEEQKAGIDAANAPALLGHILENCPHLAVQGLMCLPPVFDAGWAARPYFAMLRELRDKLARQFGLALPELSMGMSGDFEAAVAEGATMIRVGTDIFGPRPVKN